ncbi:hypothetical protein OV207_07235 [Corallococcus sp. BB11-1]|uniref:hypothetical protein n=1 Tax=Corallococcus sp. BB11-1 TaxID=2996783 RepID=UPI0010D9AA7A|nr:hypothetical protein [Corallococcus sp. BB11-1]MCY1031245.1 hypothetical protein [Corallococcus sp. BB11-1]RYZ33216.1 MAG: hypothetical protein EOO72_14515 [Myxococcaceae bacterium]
MADGINPKHLDKRTTERYQRGDLAVEEAVKKHLEELPDVADKAVPIDTRMDGEVDDLDDDEDDDLDDEEDDADDEEDDVDDAEDSEGSNDEDKAAE